MFTDSSRFMSSSLASLVDNLSKVGTIICKKCFERYSTKSECRYIKENNKLIYKCEQCDKLYSKKISILSKKFVTTYHFCYENPDKFLLLLKKGLFP